jgi:site-specific recombinase XerD
MHVNVNDRVERAARTLGLLPAESRDAVVTLIERMGEAGGVESAGIGYVLPADGVEAWVTRMRGELRSERTIGMYRYLAEQFLRDYPDPTRLEVQQYLTERLDNGRSPAFVENVRKALSSLFKFLYQEGLVSSNPLDGLRAIRVPYSEKKLPTPEDIQKVLGVSFTRDKNADKMRTIVVLLMTTGLRLSEALGLRKDSIDFSAKEMMVVGKGSKQRVVPLLQVTADTLNAYIKKYPSESPFVFPGNTKTGLAEIHNVEKTLRRTCARAGVRPFTPHQLRHFYATEMLRNGAKLEVVGRILGHSGIGVTADIYRHVGTEEMHEAVERLGPTILPLGFMLFAA